MYFINAHLVLEGYSYNSNTTLINACIGLSRKGLNLKKEIYEGELKVIKPILLFLGLRHINKADAVTQVLQESDS